MRLVTKLVDATILRHPIASGAGLFGVFWLGYALYLRNAPVGIGSSVTIPANTPGFNHALQADVVAIDDRGVWVEATAADTGKKFRLGPYPADVFRRR